MILTGKLLGKIIESNPARPQVITSVRGEGWMLAAERVERIGKRAGVRGTEKEK